MLVTLPPIVTLVSPVQPEKAEEPILVPLVILTVKEVGFACVATVLTFDAEPVMLVGFSSGHFFQGLFTFENAIFGVIPAGCLPHL